MSKNRVFQNCPLNESDKIQLDQRATHHLLNVLRVRSNDSILLFNSDGNEYKALLEIQGKKLFANIIEKIVYKDQNQQTITMVQGISRGDRMDWCIQKAVELGVHHITPIYCERSMKALDEKRLQKKMLHWQGIIISACEQSGRRNLATLAQPKSLADYTNNPNDAQLRLILNPLANTSLASRVSSTETVEIVVGPEGGLTEAEIATLEAKYYQSVSLGPRILRTETAGVAALAIIQSHIGDLK